MSNLTVAVDYTYADMQNLQRLFDVNLAPASRTEPDGRLVYRSPRPNATFNRMLREITAKALYSGGDLSAKRRLTAGTLVQQRLQFQACYTFGRARTTTRTSATFRRPSIRTGRTLVPSTPGRTTTSATTS